MHQISTHVYIDDVLLSLEIPTGRLPNPYHDYPFLIIPEFLSPMQCEEITAFTLMDQTYSEASLRGREIDVTIRKTHLHAISDLHKQIYSERFDQYRQSIENFFSLTLIASTPIQALGYAEGSFYVEHADDSSQLRDASGKLMGFKPVAPERKVSSVLFVNDDFEGGELCFNYLMDIHGETIRLRPKAGDMILFLSNPYFSHEVLPVQHGYRITFVQWHNALL